MPSLFAAVIGLLLASMASAQDNGGAVTTPQDNVPQWATNNALQMNISSADGQSNPLQYTVIPLTKYVGLNGTQSSPGTIDIVGSMVAADVSNFNKIKNQSVVAYLSCDTPSNSGFITPNQMLNALINVNLRAIVLYSTNNNWCSLSATDLTYMNILSMADSAEASQALGYLNDTSNGRVIIAEITGNATGSPDTSGSSGSSGGGGGGGSNSAVAMSILYTITGLITLLFLVIIGSGAIRAHRFPERYGPRGALAGRPRQSRAKGLARAVLDTLPIVKFNNQERSKPDPELELETATTDTRDQHDATSQRRASHTIEERSAEHAEHTTATESAEPVEVVGVIGTELPVSSTESKNATDSSSGANMGCSICTEDFKVGEDMRVLPCNHQFHPDCIDPWLVNVSGTCPLCRLDLRPEPTITNTLPPPLALGAEDGAGGSGAHRNRISRIFDINRLRQASTEEQLEALRLMRNNRGWVPPQPESEEGERGAQTEATHDTPETHDTQESPDTQDTHSQNTQDIETERSQTARLTAKLKEKFRIRTRARSPTRSDHGSE